jgi:hypothetical protein
MQEGITLVLVCGKTTAPPSAQSEAGFVFFAALSGGCYVGIKITFLLFLLDV